MRKRNCQPTLDFLEAREAPVGFYQGPPLAPIYLALSGTLQGQAQVSSQAGGTSIRISATGRVHSLGLTSVTGTLQIRNGQEFGALVLNSPRNRMTLNVEGATGTPLAFRISQGMATVPNTTWQFVREVGSGTLTLSATTPGRGPVSLTLQS